MVVASDKEKVIVKSLCNLSKLSTAAFKHKTFPVKQNMSIFTQHDRFENNAFKWPCYA